MPGIAGFVLTIGAAVDANVLINERIREEQRVRPQPIHAVEFGYKEASRAIFDANITNVISAVIMFAFGSGPIRGFAVVLAIGIVTSVFTGGHLHASARRRLAEAQPPQVHQYLRPPMRPLKLIPDNTNIPFLKYRYVAIALSIGC